MNTARLYEIATLLIRADDDHHIQQTLDALRSEAENLANNPAHEGFQANVVSHLDDLQKLLEQFGSRISPALWEAISSIGAAPYFSSSMALGIRATLAASSITPAVLRDDIDKLVSERR